MELYKIMFTAGGQIRFAVLLNRFQVEAEDVVKKYVKEAYGVTDNPILRIEKIDLETEDPIVVFI
jgi:hypothetical protein